MEHRPRAIPHLAAWLLLALVSAAIYAPFLDNPLVFDDQEFFSAGLLAEFASAKMLVSWPLRWVSYGSFGLSFALLGPDVLWFRLGNLAVHTGVAVALYHFVHMALRVGAGARPRSGAREAAFIGALWFAVHPVAVYGAGYLVERTIVMAAFFALLSLIFLMRGISEKKGWPLALSALCYLLAVFSKEHAVALPGVAALIVAWRRTEALDSKRGLAALFVAYGLIAVFVSLRAKGLLGTPYEPFAMEYFRNLTRNAIRIDVEDAHILSAQTQAGLFFEYLKIWLLPLPQWLSVDLRRAFSTEIAEPAALAAIAAFLAYPLGCWLLWRRGGVAALGALALMFPWVLFSVEFSVARIQEPFVLYRSYLWMTGFALLPAIAAWTLVPVIRRTLAALAIALLALGAAERLTTFTSEFALWDDAVRKYSDPSLLGAWRGYANRGAMHGKAQRWSEALEDLDRALRLHPDYAYALLNRGNVNAALERREAAIADFTRGLAVAREMDAPDMAAYALARRGMLLGQSGDVQAGFRDFLAAVQLAPSWGLVRNLFAQFLLEHRYRREASEQFRLACTLGEPDACAALRALRGHY